MNQNNHHKNTRRGFLKETAAGTTGLLIVSAKSVKGSAANSAIEFGIIGCGGRGNYVTTQLLSNAPDDVKIVAAQDFFDDRLQRMHERIDIEKSRLYKGLDAHNELIESGVDAVVITSPPYFHPEQAKATVQAGKHVWMAKPIAVDVPGCQSILETSQKAKGKMNFLVDFQTRNSPHFKECVSRVHNGEIGDLVLGHVFYHTGRLGRKDKPGMPEDEKRLRNWVFDIVLSGDIIVEQNIHVLDVANWYIGSHPIKAHGTGGRKARTDVGDCWDHFIVTYWYPNDIKVDFSSAQFTKGYNDLCIRMYGSKGTADSHYNGPVKITGDNPWPGTDHDNTGHIGVGNNVKDFVKGLRSGNYVNHGQYAVQSTLTSILGRMASYSGEEVTWDKMMEEGEKMEAELEL